MDFLNSNGSGALALEALCQGAAQELLMRNYTIRTAEDEWPGVTTDANGESGESELAA